MFPLLLQRLHFYEFPLLRFCRIDPTSRSYSNRPTTNGLRKHSYCNTAHLEPEAECKYTYFIKTGSCETFQKPEILVVLTTCFAVQKQEGYVPSQPSSGYGAPGPAPGPPGDNYGAPAPSPSGQYGAPSGGVPY
jgi:hypothetical protein